MGNTEVRFYHGDIVADFPTSISLSEPNGLADVLKFSNTALKITAMTTKALPYGQVPSMVLNLLTIIVNFKLDEFKEALLQEKIDTAILNYGINTLNSEINSIKDSLEIVKREGTKSNLALSEIVYCRNRAVFILSQFENKDQIFWKYPLYSLENFGVFSHLFVGILQLSKNLEGNTEDDVNKYLERLKIAIKEYTNKFFSKRQGKVYIESCTFRYERKCRKGYSRTCISDGKEQTLYDFPWEKKKYNRIKFEKLWHKPYCRWSWDGSEDSRLWVSKVKDYLDMLEDAYCKFFIKFFPPGLYEH